MFGYEYPCFSLWWLIPLVMMALCFFMMRRRRGGWPCGLGVGHMDEGAMGHDQSASEILDKRYARGEIDEEEYRSKRAILHFESQ